MKPLRIPAGLILATFATFGAGAFHLPWPPDFLLLPVADVARGGAPVLAMMAGLLAGLLEDVLTVSGRLLGLHAFTKTLVGYLLATLGARTIVEKPLAVGGLLAGAVFFESGLLVLLLWVLRGEALLPGAGALAARAATTGVLGAALHAASRVPWRARWSARRRRRLG